MGGVLARAKKPIRDFNLERRLDAALEAPKMKNPTKRDIDPNSELYKKDSKLIDRVNMTKLKDSIEPTTRDHPNPDNRPKLSREPVTEPEFGYYLPTDPARIPAGKTTLPRLLDMLAKVAPPSLSGAPPLTTSSAQQNDAASSTLSTERAAMALTPEKLTDLAKEYKLKPEHIAGIASRFKLFDLHIPNPRTTTVKRMQLLSEQLRLGNATTLQLDDENDKADKAVEPRAIKASETKQQKKIASGAAEN